MRVGVFGRAEPAGLDDDFVFLAEHYLAEGFPDDCWHCRYAWRARHADRFARAPASDLEVAAVVAEVLGS